MRKRVPPRQYQLSIPYERYAPAPGRRLWPASTVSRPFQLSIHNRVHLEQPSLDCSDFPIALPHPVELHLMRHGESAANAERLVTGSSNVPLTEVGIRQAREVGKQLSSHYDVAFSSTLFRARKTLSLALRAARVTGVSIRLSPCLDERQLGELELQPVRPIPEYSAGNFMFAPPGGENYRSVTGRALGFLTDIARWILDEWEKRQRRIERILVCTHMGPLRIIAGILTEEAEATKVLALSFRPTEMLKFQWTQLSYPRFRFSEEEMRDLGANPSYPDPHSHDCHDEGPDGTGGGEPRPILELAPSTSGTRKDHA